MKRLPIICEVMLIFGLMANPAFSQDTDNDGIPDNEDNCLAIPNGPTGGTCIDCGNNFLGGTCATPGYNPSECGIGGFCNMNQDDYDQDGTGDVCDDEVDGDGFFNDEDNCFCVFNQGQEDSYPPEGNNIGDECDCEADFDCSGGVDATDVAAFFEDFGRNQYNDPCTSGNQCKGDFECDGDTDATNATKFLEDFGRGMWNDPCPICEVGDWCDYTTTTTIAGCIGDGESCTYSSACCNGCCCSSTGGVCGFPYYCQCVPTIICEDLAGDQCQQ
jgi:hypothetical protein